MISAYVIPVVLMKMCKILTEKWLNLSIYVTIVDFIEVKFNRVQIADQYH